MFKQLLTILHIKLPFLIFKQSNHFLYKVTILIYYISITYPLYSWVLQTLRTETMKSKTSYYVCPNYFIHKKEHSLILCSFLFLFDENYITKVTLLYKQKSFNAYLCTIADSSLRRGDSIFYPIFPLKNHSTPFFPWSREDFHSLNRLFES